MKTSSILRRLLFGLIYVLILTACRAAPGPAQLPQPTDTAISAAEPTSFSPDTPVPATVTSAPVGILLGAEQGWQSVGIFVRKGQELEVTAAGKWSHALEDTIQPNPYGPGGVEAFDPDSILTEAPLGSLLGRIGENPPFLIGEHATLTAEQSGELALSINDNPIYLPDNSGSLEVTIALGPSPQVRTQLLTNAADGYLLLYPSDYHAVVYENGMCLTVAEVTVLACHVANAFVEVRDAAGRTLEQVADEVAADANPDIPVKRTSLTIAGEEAILLDDIYSVDVLRKAVIVRGGQTYILTFVPWTDTREEFPRLENLYDTVINSFTFLPQPGGSAESPGVSDPHKTEFPSTVRMQADGTFQVLDLPPYAP